MQTIRPMWNNQLKLLSIATSCQDQRIRGDANKRPFWVSKLSIYFSNSLVLSNSKGLKFFVSIISNQECMMRRACPGPCPTIIYVILFLSYIGAFLWRFSSLVIEYQMTGNIPLTLTENTVHLPQKARSAEKEFGFLVESKFMTEDIKPVVGKQIQQRKRIFFLYLQVSWKAFNLYAINDVVKN